MARVIARHGVLLGFQRPPGAGKDEPYFAPGEKQISVPISREWLELLGWTAARPELNLVIDSDGIHITPAHPQPEEPPRVLAGAEGEE
jgi:hypothetical protein